MGPYDIAAVLFVLACLGALWFLRNVIFGESNKVIDAPVEAEVYQIGDRKIVVRSERFTPEQRARLRKAYQNRTGLYDQTTDTYL